jgi:hypothetical protein
VIDAYGASKTSGVQQQFLGVLGAAGAFGKSKLVFHRSEVSLRERSIGGGAGPDVRLGHAEAAQCLGTVILTGQQRASIARRSGILPLLRRCGPVKITVPRHSKLHWA